MRVPVKLISCCCSHSTLVMVPVLVPLSKRYFLSSFPRSEELRTQKLKSHVVRTQSLNVLPLKPGVGQYIAIHATLTARSFFLANVYSSSSFTCIFFQNLSRFLLCWLWLTHGSCADLQNKIGHPAGRRQVPVLSARGISVGSKKMTFGIMTCEMNNLQIGWSLCSALM